MKNQETTYNITIGTPSPNGFGWSHTTKEMTMKEYLETRNNLHNSSCTIRGPIEWDFEEGVKRRAKRSKKRKEASKQRSLWAEEARKRNK